MKKQQTRTRSPRKPTDDDNLLARTNPNVGSPDFDMKRGYKQKPTKKLGPAKGTPRLRDR